MDVKACVSDTGLPLLKGNVCNVSMRVYITSPWFITEYNEMEMQSIYSSGIPVAKATERLVVGVTASCRRMDVDLRIKSKIVTRDSSQMSPQRLAHMSRARFG